MHGHDMQICSKAPATLFGTVVVAWLLLEGVRIDEKVKKRRKKGWESEKRAAARSSSAASRHAVIRISVSAINRISQAGKQVKHARKTDCKIVAVNKSAQYHRMIATPFPIKPRIWSLLSALVIARGRRHSRIAAAEAADREASFGHSHAHALPTELTLIAWAVIY